MFFCKSRSHCNACLNNNDFKKSLMEYYNWDGICSFEYDNINLPPVVDVVQTPVSVLETPKPCPTKVCRRTNTECDSYWSCRDICRITGNRLTDQENCPLQK